METLQLQIAAPYDVSRVRWQQPLHLLAWPHLQNDFKQPQIPKKNLLPETISWKLTFLEYRNEVDGTLTAYFGYNMSHSA